MKLTLSVSYGVGVLLRIQEQSRSGPVTAARIARGCRFPPRFLYRVLRKLVDAGLLRGVSGPGGGYALARQPQDISLLDIVEGVEGEIEPTILEAPCAAQRSAIDRVNVLCQQNAKQFSVDLAHISLVDLARSEAPRRQAKSRSKIRAK